MPPSFSRFASFNFCFLGLGNVLGRHDDVTDGSLLLSNNFMSDGGKQYAACAAVFAGYVFDTQITQNTITDFSCAPRRPCVAPAPPSNLCFADSSISVGWGWGGSKFLGYVDSFRVLNL